MGYVMKSHRDGYTNAKQLLRSYVLYDQTVQRYVSPALYYVPYLVLDTEY